MTKLRIVGTSDDKDVKELLAEAEAVLTANPLEGYFPHPKQDEFHRSQVPVKAFIGGNRSGKTTASVVDDLIQCVDREVLPDHLLPYKKWQPPFKCRIITPDLGRTMAAVTEKLRHYVPKSQLQGGSWEKAYDKQHRVLRFTNGSQLDFMSSEMDLDKFGGVALHRVHYDEEPPGEKGKAIRRDCQTRLIDYNGDEVLSMTPLMGLSWVYDEVWERRHESTIAVFQVDMDENPHLNQEAKERRLADLSDDERKAIKEGRFVHFGGLFYGEFSDAEHVVPQPTRKHLHDQSIVVGIDPGYRRTGIVWVAFDNDNNALVFDELYPSEQVVGPIATAIKKKNAFWGLKSPVYVVDPSARNRQTINAEGVEGEFAREGIFCQHGQNDRASGILEVKGRLQHEGLLISNNCRHLIWEIGRYRRDTNSDDEFASIKQDDHLLDALRYAVMSRVWGLPPKHTKRWAVPNYTPDFQRPYKDEVPLQREAPPLGAYS